MSDVIYILCFSSAEVERDADEEDIKVGYRRLAKYYHPDGESPYSSLLL
jgi:DnaJ-class molecular chaperone